MPFSSILKILLLGSLWGPSFFFIKICLNDMTPLTLSSLRFFIAASLLWLVVIFKQCSVPTNKTVLCHLFIMSIFSMALPINLICMAERNIDSALAGIINGCVPLSTVFLAHFFIKGEQITLKRFLGVSAGLIGFLVLLVPTLVDKEIDADSIGLLSVGLAAMCYSIGMIYAKKFLQNIQGIIIPTIQVSFAAILSFIACLLFEMPFSAVMPSNNSLLALLGLSILGTVCAFIMYYKILDSDGPVVLAMTAYLLPLYAIFLGIVFLHEPVTWKLFIAIFFILLGLVLINKKPQINTLSR